MNKLINKSSIINDKVFRRYIYAYVITQINLWIIPILTPILLNKRLGIGQEFALSLGLQWLPSILMGPITGIIMKRWGPHKIYIMVMCLYSLIIMSFPFAENLLQLQVIILGLGIAQAMASPCSLTLRAYVIPEGKEVAGNAIIVGTQRLAKIIGPLLAGILVAAFSVETTFMISSLLCIPSIIALIAIPIKYPKQGQDMGEKKRDTGKIRRMVQPVFKMLFSNKLILGLFVTAIGYTITLGALKIYLFSLADILGEEETVYSILLASQGCGALLGAVFSHKMIGTMQRKLSLPAIYAVVSIVEGLLLCMMNLYVSIYYVVFILVVAAIFETLAFVTYFSLLQKLITKEDQGLYNSITMPIIDSSYLIGVALMGLIINTFSLNVILQIAASFTIITVVLFLKPFMMTKDRELTSTIL